jgi:molybdate transport system substrate-binding protein
MSGILLAAGVAKSALEALAAAGHLPGIELRFGTAGALRDRALAGEGADAICTSMEALAALAAAGRLVGDAQPIGAAGTGLAVAAGLSFPTIDSEAGFRDALLAARRIGWADPAKGATGGRHFAAVIARLGIEAEVRAKSLLVDFGVDAVAACGRGEVDLAVSQATEILGRPGVALLGLFPPPHDLSTGYGIAALSDTPAAAASLRVFAGPAARAELAATGFTLV